MNALDFDHTVAASVGWRALVATPGNRRRMRIIVALAFFSQWSGNGLVSYYLNKVFDSIGITDPTTQVRTPIEISFSTFSEYLNHRPAPYQRNSTNLELGLGAPRGCFVRSLGPKAPVPDFGRRHAHLLYHANYMLRRVRHSWVACRGAHSYCFYIPILCLLRVCIFSDIHLGCPC